MLCLACLTCDVAAVQLDLHRQTVAFDAYRTEEIEATDEDIKEEEDESQQGSEDDDGYGTSTCDDSSCEPPATHPGVRVAPAATRQLFVGYAIKDMRAGRCWANE
jgi:hypothetical protein